MELPGCLSAWCQLLPAAAIPYPATPETIRYTDTESAESRRGVSAPSSASEPIEKEIRPVRLVALE
jgi:hypothetical protein